MLLMHISYVLAFLLFVLTACTTSTELSENQMNHAVDQMTMKVHAGKERSVMLHDTTITFQELQAETGKEAVLVFSLTKNNEPVTHLDIMHEKPMHVILVRKDLRYFDHIHPIEQEQGLFSVSYTFVNSGEYRVWVEFMSDGMQHFVDFDLNVAGKQEKLEEDKTYGLVVTPQLPERIEQGKPAVISFIITDEYHTPVALTDTFLGDAGHFVAIDGTLGEFNHVHDALLDNNNVLSFMYTAEKVGKHRAWAQFSHRGKERVAPVEFLVHKA